MDYSNDCDDNVQHENVGEWFEFRRQIPFVNDNVDHCDVDWACRKHSDDDNNGEYGDCNSTIIMMITVRMTIIMMVITVIMTMTKMLATLMIYRVFVVSNTGSAIPHFIEKSSL